MNTFSKGIFFTALFFAGICYMVCSFLIEAKYAILLSLFTGAILYLVFSIFDRFYSKKAVKLLDKMNEDPSYKQIVNYYDSELIGNGFF